MPDVGNTLVITGNPSITGLSDDITHLTQEVAPEFVPGQEYQVGQMVSHNGHFYVFTEYFGGGTWEQALPRLMDTTVSTQLELMPDKIVQTVASMQYSRTFIQEDDPALNPANEVHIGDYWILPQDAKTWNQLKKKRWYDLYHPNTDSGKRWGQFAGFEIVYCWDGEKWIQVYDTSMVYTAYSRITQTADMIKHEVERANGAEGRLYTAIEQTADAIKLYAEQYTTDHAYAIQSGITIEAAGITVSGAKYLILESGGYLRVTTPTFGIDTSASDNDYMIWSGGATGSQSVFSVKKNGDIKCTSGVIGGFTLADEWLTSGSGATYVRLSGKASDDYAIVCGSETASSAPFSVKRDGTLKAKDFDYIGHYDYGVYITEELIRFTVGNSKIDISAAGVDILGDMHVNLGTLDGNHVYISENDGIEMVGSRVTVNGKPMWARDDIIVLKNGENEADIIAAQASIGAEDWVLIKPYYNAKVQAGTNPGETFSNMVHPSNYAYDGSGIIPLVFTSDETQLGNKSEYYKFTVTCKIWGTSINTNVATVYVANLSIPTTRYVSFTVTGGRNWDGNAQDASGTYTFNQSDPQYQNICNGNDIGVFIKTGSAASLNVSDIVVMVETSEVTSRVPCSVYYFPPLPSSST